MKQDQHRNSATGARDKHESQDTRTKAQDQRQKHRPGSAPGLSTESKHQNATKSLPGHNIQHRITAHKQEPALEHRISSRNTGQDQHQDSTQNRSTRTGSAPEQHTNRKQHWNTGSAPGLSTGSAPGQNWISTRNQDAAQNQQ